MAKDLSEMKAEDAIKAVEKLSGDDRAAAIDAERAGKNRVSVLEALGVERDPEGTIRSGTGRILGPNEADPKVAAKANLGATIRQYKEELESSEAHVEPSVTPGGGGAVTPLGTGAAPVGIAGATGGAGTVGTAGGPATGGLGGA